MGDAEACAALIDARPSQSLEPRNVILTLMHALHKKNLDTPSARFGCAVVLRFLAPENPASRATPQRFAEYLAQPWSASFAPYPLSRSLASSLLCPRPPLWQSLAPPLLPPPP